MRHREGASIFGVSLAAMGICCATTTLVAAGLGVVAIGLFVVGPLAAVVLGITLTAVIRHRPHRGGRIPHLSGEPRDIVEPL